MIFYFLTPTVFPNYLTGSIIFWYTVKIFSYKETKFQSYRVNSFCVEHFQKEVILADFRWYYDFFTLFRSFLFTKNATAPTVFMILECGLQYYTHNETAYKMRETKFQIFAPNFFRACKIKRFNLLIHRSPFPLFGGFPLFFFWKKEEFFFLS